MIAVIFEVHPAPGKIPEYLDIAASLRRELEHADGFISIERFESLTNEGKFCHFPFGGTMNRWKSGGRFRDIA